MRSSAARVAWLLLSLMPAVGCQALPGRSPTPGMTFEESLVFHPSRYPDGDWDHPGVAVEDAWFEASDGTRLHGWFAAAEKPRAVVLYAHGNAGNITNRVNALRLLRDQLHASVFVFDYRGFGRSGGSPSEAGVLDDARSARRWLARRAGVPEVDVVLLGNSLGGGVAVDLAARDGARGLILENTFTSIPDVAASHVKLLPVCWLLETRLDSLAKIPNYAGQLLQTHGDEDRTVPFELGKRLFDAAKGPKQFVVAPGGGHNDPPTRDYLLALDRFLDALPAHGQPPLAR